MSRRTTQGKLLKVSNALAAESSQHPPANTADPRLRDGDDIQEDPGKCWQTTRNLAEIRLAVPPWVEADLVARVSCFSLEELDEGQLKE